MNEKWLDRIPHKTVLCYLILSGLGATVSNAVLHYFISDIRTFSRIEVYKDWAFVAITAVILYLLLTRYVVTIRHQEQNYQTLADSGQALIWMAALDSRRTYFNKTWLEFTGRTLEQEMGAGWSAGVHPDDRERCLDMYTGSYAGREKFSMEYRLLRHDGEYRWLQDDGSPWYDRSGKFIGYIGFCLDVTEAKRLELDHARNSEFLATILECLSDGVAACDKDGRLQLFNRSTREFHGLPEQPLLPEQWAAYYSLYEKDGITRMKTENIPLYKALQGMPVVNQEMVIIPEGAKPRTLLATGRQLVSRSGEKMGAVVSMHDVTRVKALEDHIRQSQKLDSIGTLAGGVAHDFNNIMTTILGAGALLEMNCGNDPEQVKILSRITDSAERGAKLTQSLLAFSRRQAISRQAEEVGSLINTMEDLLGRIIGDDILLTTYLPDEPLLVMIDRGRIEQVLMNLTTNARDAMPHGGVLNIAVSRVENGIDQLNLEECRPGSYVLITVTDSGEGINAAAQQRIFEPFFSTRGIGRATGLGLSVAYGIIRQHDGAIHVYSEPSGGTIFRIYLPLCTHTAQ